MIEQAIDFKALQKSGYIIDWLPKNLKVGTMFIMSGYTFLHVGKRKVVLVLIDGVDIELPYA